MATSISGLKATIRFTTSIPDITLILDPDTTTALYLKHLVRTEIPPPASLRRLRFIYGGKILLDKAVLSSILKISPPPPQRQNVKGKGRAMEEMRRVYINCSIGDELSDEELAAEKDAALAAQGDKNNDPDGAPQEDEEEEAEACGYTRTTTRAPRGFDRLLDTGFTPAEVGQLRLQFLSVRAAMYTPDTMPSPDTLRRMEDEWIDDNGGANGVTSGNTADAEVVAGAVDDLLVGLVIGFIWPLGVMCWAMREEGIWSPRRQTAIWSGFMMAVMFGCMNYLG